MSTILKALRRLEQEKAKVDRPLREQITGGDADAGEAEPRRRWPILAGGVGAGVVAGIAVLFLLRHDAVAPVAPEAALNPALPQRGSVPRAPVLPQAALPHGEPLDAVDTEDVAVVHRRPVPPRIATEDIPAAPAAAALEAPREPEPARALVSVSAPERAPTRPAPPPAPVPAAAPSAPPPQARVAAVNPAPAPKPPAAMPKPPAAAAAKASPAKEPFPELRVERTFWHPLAERRVAVIAIPGRDPQELHEGAAVAGARVALIEPSGVVFRFEGRDVRRKIGETP